MQIVSKCYSVSDKTCHFDPENIDTTKNYVQDNKDLQNDQIVIKMSLLISDTNNLVAKVLLLCSC